MRSYQALPSNRSVLNKFLAMQTFCKEIGKPVTYIVYDPHLPTPFLHIAQQIRPKKCRVKFSTITHVTLVKLLPLRLGSSLNRRWLTSDFNKGFLLSLTRGG